MTRPLSFNSSPLYRRAPVAGCGAFARAFLAGLMALAGSAAQAADAPTPADVRAVKAPKPDGAASAPRAPVKRVALVIGNAAYTRIDPLVNSRNDAEDMCGALKALRFEVRCHYDISTRSEFRLIVRQFAAALSPDTVALFYYAGHAVQMRGDNLLLPTRVDGSSALDLEDDSLSLSYLLRSLESARSLPNIVILDACREDPFARTSSVAGVGFSRGLARVDPPVGTVLVYATAPGGVAFDGKDRNGLFTRHLLKHMARPDLKLSELLQVVAMGVEEEARTRYRYEQVPYRSYSYGGQMCLAGCDEESIAAQMKELRQRSDETRQRVRSLEDENQRLNTYAAEQRLNVASLESKLRQLNQSASESTGVTTQTRAEIARLQAALTAARDEQAGRASARQDNEVREAELTTLRSKLAEMKEQARVLEEYRKTIQDLQKKNKEQARIIDEGAPAAPPARRSVVLPTF